jgi:hypothetical protein
MGAEDVRRQALNVFRIQMLGAKVIYTCLSKFAVSHSALGCPSALGIVYTQGCRQ